MRSRRTTRRIERRIDLAEVNGRVFVNNASMGLYAKIVQSPDYRDAKVRTAAETLPDLIGPNAVPLDLRFTLPSGEQITSANLVLVSNNPYQPSHLRGASTRPRLDSGRLGVVSVLVRGAGDAEKLAALEAAGQVSRFAGWNEWAATEFEVTSGGPVEVGVDGEALLMESPLRFVIRPGALTIRLPRSVLSRRTAAPAVHVVSTSTLGALWQTALGQPGAGGMSGDDAEPVVPPPSDRGDPGDAGVEPAEERLARRLDERAAAAGHPVAARTSDVLHRLGALDRTVYVAVARMSTPVLDLPLSRLSHFANHSKPWFVVAGCARRSAGHRGGAALTGVAAIGAASLVVNQPMKLAGNRARPDRTGHEVPEARWVKMPTSTSFPSGHSASALAFAVAVGDVVPALRWPLRAAGGTVAFSRVYTGVHYPGDVLVGAATGALLGGLVSRLGRRVANR